MLFEKNIEIKNIIDIFEESKINRTEYRTNLFFKKLDIEDNYKVILGDSQYLSNITFEEKENYYIFYGYKILKDNIYLINNEILFLKGTNNINNFAINPIIYNLEELIYILEDFKTVPSTTNYKDKAMILIKAIDIFKEKAKILELNDFNLDDFYKYVPDLNIRNIRGFDDCNNLFDFWNKNKLFPNNLTEINYFSDKISLLYNFDSKNYSLIDENKNTVFKEDSNTLFLFDAKFDLIILTVYENENSVEERNDLKITIIQDLEKNFEYERAKMDIIL